MSPLLPSVTSQASARSTRARAVAPRRASRPTPSPDAPQGPVPLRAIGVEASDDASADPEDLKAALAAKQDAVAKAAEGTSLADTAKLLEALTKDPEAGGEEEGRGGGQGESRGGGGGGGAEPELTYWEKVPPLRRARR